ncbi:hypothetical protein [Mesorhizobium sp.]|uniref:hypothetical protein n=1 Tax=Mesorhizobium sp. TaxID=1871066 RepID=UPI0025CC1021|nr:hypothetical protein [Mesorhizobium sp.]
MPAWIPIRPKTTAIISFVNHLRVCKEIRGKAARRPAPLAGKTALGVDPAIFSLGNQAFPRLEHIAAKAANLLRKNCSGFARRAPEIAMTGWFCWQTGIVPCIAG